MKASILNHENKSVGEVELNDGIFAAKINKALIYETVKMQRANRRKGSASSKTRGDVSGTTAKMYRQKGTGRARHGDERAGIFIGGGKAFGPHPRSFAYRIPKKALRVALRSVLSAKLSEGKLLIVDNFSLDGIKTKTAVERFKSWGVASGLIVTSSHDKKLECSVRNIPRIKTLNVHGLNVYDVLKYDRTIVLKEALDELQEVLKP